MSLSNLPAEGPLAAVSRRRLLHTGLVFAASAWARPWDCITHAADSRSTPPTADQLVPGKDREPRKVPDPDPRFKE